jgi:hypothetical protein
MNTKTTQTNIAIRTETLRAVKLRQPIWTTALQDLTEGLADTDMVRTYTRREPFGNYLLHIEPATEGN